MQKEVICRGCGIIRMAEIEASEGAEEFNVIARTCCQACSCPFVDLMQRNK